jgi:hypothetical protein
MYSFCQTVTNPIAIFLTALFLENYATVSVGKKPLISYSIEETIIEIKAFELGFLSPFKQIKDFISLKEVFHASHIICINRNSYKKGDS